VLRNPNYKQDLREKKSILLCVYVDYATISLILITEIKGDGGYGTIPWQAIEAGKHQQY
jgi:hypothetical protein